MNIGKLSKEEVKQLLSEYTKVENVIYSINKPRKLMLKLSYLNNQIQAWYQINGLKANEGLKQHWKKLDELIGFHSQVYLTGREFSTKVWGCDSYMFGKFLVLHSFRGTDIMVDKKINKKILHCLLKLISRQLYNVDYIHNNTWDDYCEKMNINCDIKFFVSYVKNEKLFHNDIHNYINWIHFNNIYELLWKKENKKLEIKDYESVGFWLKGFPLNKFGDLKVKKIAKDFIKFVNETNEKEN